MSRSCTSQISSAVVVGASRGLGRGIALALADAGADVLALAREPFALDRVGVLAADATDPGVAAEALASGPDALVVAAGAVPPMAPLSEQTWESLSVCWEADVRITFVWLQAALAARVPRVVLVSSGAALQGSPLSGGYAGAKATQRFLASYAQAEAPELAFTTLLPGMTLAGAVGRAGVGAYAAQRGISEEAFVAGMGPELTPELAGAAVLELLATDRDDLVPAYALSGAGLRAL